jgi:hypothetical protein
MFAAYAARGFICILARPPPQSSARFKGEGAERHGEAPFPFCFFHLVMTALRAISDRRSGLKAAALAGPPFFPPLRPRATA